MLTMRDQGDVRQLAEVPSDSEAARHSGGGVRRAGGDGVGGQELTSTAISTLRSRVKLRTRLRPYANRLRLYAERRRRRRLYRRFLSPGDLCFDVGANVGNRVETFLHLGAHVTAIEPLATCGRTLTERFGHHPEFTLLQVALGREPGEATIQIPEESAIASMSEDFIRQTTESGRFAAYHWTDTATVEVTTLDALIATHGPPRFVKIDVEGYEAEVLAGLSVALPALSFEFVPELGGIAAACIERLETLATYRYSLSLGESMELGPWRNADSTLAALNAMSAPAWGDVYARL